MNEASRQSYLKALGLTPWVARAPLPGAAPSPWLDWEEEQDPPVAQAHVSAGEPVGSVPAAEQTRAEGSSPAVSLKDSLEAPKPAPVQRTEPVETSAETGMQPAPQPPESVAANGNSVTFTLEAHQGNGTWLLCAQEDTQAPGLGRFEAPLMASLLAVFQGRPGRPRRFFCPLTDQPMQAQEAAQALSAFIAGLCDQTGGERVLLALPESLNEALFNQPRYQSFDIGGQRALVISALSEMLADPATHKKASWQAMQEHGFDGV
ncbi:hypothetical protein [Alcanivorax sediminis]|uniref:Uncharacterized protein n=1 Tax=Alcanivorax sediminis TaxID=2663008 RepID=A0A6N7LW56_9GAMM|nr:hypothetical protein [Alcanivorax sediminis]MQX54493.1 hypothetical protein [Alcanivorax sediminis]